MADQSDMELLKRIEAFDIDGGPVALTFERRLSLENGWSERFAERSVREYKRFVYLAMVAGHPVTPSEEVDEVWHLHLTYTNSYWNRFCGEVLPRPLHHNPTQGGKVEDAKYFDWYAKTLASYRFWFHVNPPGDIWPAPQIRFSTGLERRKIDPRKNWVIRKPPWQSAMLVVALCFTGCAAVNFSEILTLDAEVWLLCGFLVLVGVVAIAKFMWNIARGQPTGSKAVSSRWGDGGWSGWWGGCGGSGCATGGGSDCGGSDGGGGGCAAGGCGGGGGD